MQNRKKLLPFVYELFVFALIVALLAYGVIRGNFFVQWNALLVLLAILIVLWLLLYVAQFIWFSLLVLWDLLFQSFETARATFIEQFPFRSSPFLDKRKVIDGSVVEIKNHQFKIIANNSGKKQIFTSTMYYELEKGQRYELIYGKKSKAIVDIKRVI